MDVRQVGLLTAAVMLSAGVRAEQAGMPAADDYAYGWPVETSRSADFYEVTLPIEVYRAVADPCLRDLGVYNGSGEPVPRALAQPERNQSVSETTVSLIPLPLYEGQERDLQDLKLLVRKSAGQTTVSLDSAPPSADGQPADGRLVAYIVDIRSLKEPIDELRLAWPAMVSPFIGRLEIYASDDLEHWQPINSGSIAHLSHDGARIDRRSIEVSVADYEFLRLTWHKVPDDWSLTSLSGIRRSEGRDAGRQSLRLEPAAHDDTDGGLIFEAPGPILVDQLNLVLTADNTLVGASVFAWSEQIERWQRVTSADFYHLRGGGESVVNGPVEFSPRRVDRWKVVIDRGPDDAVLAAELGWRPDVVTFVAQGEGPYQLVAGRAADAPEDFPQERNAADAAILNLAERSEHKASARLGPRTELAGADSRRMPARSAWGVWLTWAGLILAVLLVGFMSVSLMRQMRRQS